MSPDSWGHVRHFPKHTKVQDSAEGHSASGDGRIEDLAAEMRAACMTLDDHMLYTGFSYALPSEYEVETRNLGTRPSTTAPAAMA